MKILTTSHADQKFQLLTNAIDRLPAGSLHAFRSLTTQMEQHAWVAFTVVVAVNSLCFALFHHLTHYFGWRIPQDNLNQRIKATLCDVFVTGSIGIGCNFVLSRWMNYPLSKLSITALTIAWISLRLILLRKGDEPALLSDCKGNAETPPKDSPHQIQHPEKQKDIHSLPVQELNLPAQPIDDFSPQKKGEENGADLQKTNCKGDAETPPKGSPHQIQHPEKQKDIHSLPVQELNLPAQPINDFSPQKKGEENGADLQKTNLVISATSTAEIEPGMNSPIPLKDEFSPEKQAMIEIVKKKGSALSQASPEFKADKDVVLAAVTQYGFALRYASAELKADKDVVLAAVTQNGMALWFASAELKANKEIVLAAVKQNGMALQYASTDRKDDKEIVLAAVKQYPAAAQFASAELQKDKDISDGRPFLSLDTGLSFYY